MSEGEILLRIVRDFSYGLKKLVPKIGSKVVFVCPILFRNLVLNSEVKSFVVSVSDF